MMKVLSQIIASELKARPEQVDAAVRLLDEGNTVPFIARYRKEVTGGLDDTQLRQLETRLSYLRELEERRQSILKSIDDQGNSLTTSPARSTPPSAKPSLKTSTCPTNRNAGRVDRSLSKRVWSRWRRRCGRSRLTFLSSLPNSMSMPIKASPTSVPRWMVPATF